MRRTDTIKMKDVAERVGVSVMTVSLVLRGGASGARISPDTRRRVEDAAKELAYQPNALGRALRSGRTNIIGLYAGYGYINVRLPFFTEIVSGLQEGCESVRKDLLLHGIFHGGTPEDIFNELADGRIDGLIVNIPPDDPLAKRLMRSQLPAVAIADPLPNVPSVVVDESQGGRALAEHLAGRGHKNVLYFNTPLRPISAQRRFAGFRDTALVLGMTVEDISMAGLMETGDRTLLDRLARPAAQRPSAAVCWIARNAYDLYAHCRHHGVRVPDDFAIVAFDGYATPLDGIWSLTSVRAPWADVARTAVLTLDALLKGETVPSEVVLPVEFTPGSTS